jgi:hypothetical protein
LTSHPFRSPRLEARLNALKQPTDLRWKRSMKQFQVAIVRLQHKVREDEETLTDLLNERSRMGWGYHSLTQLDTGRVAVVFEREA